MNQKLTPPEQLTLNSGHCPDCGGQLYLTARGGLAMNLECIHCHSSYWAAPFFPAERLDVKEVT